MAVEHPGEPFGKVLGYDERGVVPARLHALLRRVCAWHKRPAKLVVLLKALAHHAAGVDVTEPLYVGAAVENRNGNRNRRGVLVRVVVGNDVGPRVQRGDDADTQGDDEPHRVGEDALEVAQHDA